MNIVRLSAVLLVCGSLGIAASQAQQNAAASQQQTAPNNQSSQDQYTGVSHPPDTPIMATEPMTEPDNQQDEQPLPTYTESSTGSTAKPSPDVPASSPPAAQPVNNGAGAAEPAGSRGGNLSAANSASSGNTVSGSSTDRWDNTDYGIVTEIPKPLDQGAAVENDASLQTRQNPDYGVLSVIPFTPNALNAGTNIEVRLLQTISSNSAVRGMPFRATVIANVYRGGQVIIPAGSEMRGIITSAHPGHRLLERAELRLTPQLILLPDGTAYHLDAQVVHSGAPYTQTTDEGVIRPSRHWTKDATEYGAGAGAGAIVGAQFGPGGALVGTAVGAGAVTAHLLLQPPSTVTLPQNTELVFSLMQPMALTPTRN